MYVISDVILNENEMCKWSDECRKEEIGMVWIQEKNMFWFFEEWERDRAFNILQKLYEDKAKSAKRGIYEMGKGMG